MQALLLPGWLNSGPAHWQSRWEAVHGYTRVQQHDWQRPLRGDWIARLEEVLLLNQELLAHIPQGSTGDLTGKHTPNTNAATCAQHRGGIVLVAHSLGCHLVAAWAAASRNTHLVKAALLVAPPDVTREDFPHEMANWRRPVLGKLPFKSVCVISTNDPFSSLQASHALAQNWGASAGGGCVEIGAYGHINGDSGLNDWAAGHQLLLNIIHSSTPWSLKNPKA